MAAVKRFEDALARNESYEAFQLAQSIVSREMSCRRYNKAMEVGCRCSSALRAHGGLGLSCDLGLEIIKQFERSGVVASRVFVEQLCSMSNASVPSSGKLFTSVLRWMKESEKQLRQQIEDEEVDSDGKNSERTQLLEGLTLAYNGVYLLAGEAKLAEGAFGSAQTFFVLCCDDNTAVEKLAAMLSDWRAAGYAGERDLFPLRVVLMMLSKNSVEAADKFITLAMVAEDDEDAPTKLPAPGVQVAYFLVEAAKEQNNDFYELIKKKYSLVLRRDTSFSTLIEAIDEVIFGQKKPAGGHGLLGKLLEGLV